MHGVADTTGDMALAIRAKRYRVTAKREMHHSRTKILSVAMGASRLSLEDRFYSAFYSPAARKSCLGDPMVPQTPNVNKLKRLFRQN